MRTLIRTALLSVVLVAGFPSDALAVLGWLEKLSGPGPFTGVQVNIPFACYGKEDEGERKEIHADYDCDSAVDRHPLVIAIEIGRLTSAENGLTYANLDPRDRPDVNAVMLIPNVSIPLKLGTRGRLVDVGAGVGVLFFSDDRQFFKSFWKPALQPLRFSIKPLAWISEQRRWEFLEIEFNGTIIGGDLTSSDFGAIAGLDESSEFVWNRAILIDLYKWFANR
jgi:hypothetical protein